MAKEDDNQERDMPRNLYGIVDTCFEEGQYEAGIGVLNHLRCPKYKPAPSHIRQLLYMALYPNSSPKSEDGKLERRNSDPGSPRKIIPAKQHRTEQLLSPATSESARRLLMSFVNTNSPEALFCGLPSYTPRQEGASAPADIDDEDSYIAKESVCIRESKNCWTILKGGFIRAAPSPPPSPKKKARNRRAEPAGDTQFSTDVAAQDTPRVVADSAWPVLDWFVTLFEHDERLVEDKGLPRHSPILLSQIPNVRNGTGGRWESDAPLDIALYCLDQSEEKRRTLGLRLFALLINLTSTTHFNMPMFLASVYGRLTFLPSKQLFELLGSMSYSQTGQRFKVALCRKYLLETVLANDSGSSSTRPAPLARAQPRAVPAIVSDTEALLENPATVSIASRHPLPGSAEVLRLLGIPISNSRPSPRSAGDMYRIKFEFFVSYGNIQSQLPVDQREASWRTMLDDGRFSQTLDAAFSLGVEGTTYRQLSNSIVAVWRSSQ